MSDNDERDRGVDIELLAPEIEALRDAARRYVRAEDAGTSAVAGAGIDLETAALRYARKLDDEQRKANEIDYVKIVEDAEREKAARDREPSN